MLVLFETAAGYALFEVLKEGKLREPDELWKEFETPEAAKKTVKLVDFQKFENMSEAVASVTDLLEGKLSKDLKKFLKESFEKIEISSEKLAVMDAKIGASISKKFGIQVVSNDTVTELYRGIKQQLDALITGIKPDDISQMSLGLSHSLSRHKLKFSPDKVDNMIIQAIGLLDDLDKELNTYAMRVKEWYGWHFPEMSKIVVDNLAYAKVIKTMGFRSNAQTTDLSKILPEDLEKELKEAAEISMGSEISKEDIDNIIMGCEQVINLTEYRAELYEYLKNRMMAIAPNLTTIVGELVGARLIAHSGSLLNLAKHPASTVQILGAEKALFRALKTKNNTPKYGLIYHASLVGQAAPKNKGKVARLVATKSSLATRFDALSEEKDVQAELGHSNRKQIEKRIRILEGRNGDSGTKTEKDKGKKQKKAEPKLVSTTPSYNPSADVAGSNKSAEYGMAGSSKSAEYGAAGSSKSAEVITSGIKRKAEDISAEEESEDSTSEEESSKDNKSSEESGDEESSDDKSKDKSKKKKTKKRKLETEQKKEQPSKKTKAKEGKDKKDKKEKKKKKASEHTIVTSTNVVELKEKGSKKRKKAEDDEEKEISKSGGKAKKIKKLKESSEKKKEKTEEMKPKEEKDVKKGKQKEKEKEPVKEVEMAEKTKTKKKDKKDKKDKKKAH